MTSARPLSRLASSAPRATSVKNGLLASRNTYAMTRLLPARSWRADSLRTKPSSAIAASTRARVVGRTRCGRLSTLETVPIETPARSATSLMPAGPSHASAPRNETPQSEASDCSHPSCYAACCWCHACRRPDFVTCCVSATLTRPGEAVSRVRETFEFSSQREPGPLCTSTGGAMPTSNAPLAQVLGEVRLRRCARSASDPVPPHQGGSRRRRPRRLLAAVSRSAADSCSARPTRVTERMRQLDCEVVDAGFISDAPEGAVAAE